MAVDNSLRATTGTVRLEKKENKQESGQVVQKSQTQNILKEGRGER